MRIAHGEEAETVFAMFYRANYVPAVNLTRWRAPRSDAEALVSEAFLLTWQRLERTGDLERPWFYRTLRNKIGDHLRSRQLGELPTDHLDLLTSGLLDDGHAETIERRLIVRSVMQQLPDGHAEALALVYGCDLTTAEAAKAMGMTGVGFRKRLSRARQAFTQALSITAPQLTTREES